MVVHRPRGTETDRSREDRDERKTLVPDHCIHRSQNTTRLSRPEPGSKEPSKPISNDIVENRSGRYSIKTQGKREATKVVRVGVDASALVAPASLRRHGWRLLVLLRHRLLSGLLLRRVCVAVLRLHVSCNAVSPSGLWICRHEISRTLWGSAVTLLRLRLLWVAATAVRHLAIHGRSRHVARLTAVGHLGSTVTSTTTETTTAAASEAAATWTSV
jgi:hypothetical protein